MTLPDRVLAGHAEIRALRDYISALQSELEDTRMELLLATEQVRDSRLEVLAAMDDRVAAHLALRQPAPALLSATPPFDDCPF